MTQGIETSLSCRAPSIFSTSASYTFTDSEQKPGDNKGRALNAVPEHIFNANVNLENYRKIQSLGAV
jgi:outer membrane receptor for ferrienterochelin and colicins